MLKILLKLLRDTSAVARADLGLVARYARLRWILPAIAVIPAFYAFIYLDSVWDPASRTGALPVAIVNLDGGASVGDSASTWAPSFCTRCRRGTSSTTPCYKTPRRRVSRCAPGASCSR